ncbi:hypothetical protein VCRA2119O147_90029 [Vibrio crassostreae]|nr:hypothetical protein VCRA2118O239_20217 [Vibrio crassostreae]CAK2004439.1 hypothetical protein VCRA2113O204_20196 [Vibrio crassostreae]CAK2128463.1 hypothetical protein VCRA2113O207_40155 [Vibrio crassostreae]CAK2146407.1 hypothetical protein VCRA2113O222_40062 [Vibrio crassostreae]CAK2150734.1 hypothetical protein VCRA2113O206_40196 [Vibrio crassostreae]
MGWVITQIQTTRKRVSTEPSTQLNKGLGARNAGLCKKAI